MADQAQAAAYWDAAYAHGDDTRSWFEKHPGMLDAAGISAASSTQPPTHLDWGEAPQALALLAWKPGHLADLDQVAVGVAEVGADLDSVIFGLGQEPGAFGRPLLVEPGDVCHAHVEEPAAAAGVGRGAETDAGLSSVGPPPVTRVSHVSATSCGSSGIVACLSLGRRWLV
jgi:hypothetical protein